MLGHGISAVHERLFGRHKLSRTCIPSSLIFFLLPLYQMPHLATLSSADPLVFSYNAFWQQDCKDKRNILERTSWTIHPENDIDTDFVVSSVERSNG